MNRIKTYLGSLGRGLRTTILALAVIFVSAGIAQAATTISTNIVTGGTLDVTGATTLSNTLDATRSLSSQTTESTGITDTLTTDSSYLGGSNMTYSGTRGSSILKLIGNYSGTTGGFSMLFASTTSSGAQTLDGGGVVGVKSVVTNTAALTDGNIYGGIFIAKHDSAANDAANEAPFVGLEGSVIDNAAGNIGTAIGVSAAYHIDTSTAAFTAGAVYRGLQVTLDNSSSNSPSEQTGIAIWNMAGTQDNGIKFIKSSGGFTNDIVLQNGETISNATDGTIAFGTANLTNTGNVTVSTGYVSAPMYAVGNGATFSTATPAPAKSALQSASFWPVVTTGNTVAIAIPAMDAIDIGRHLTFAVNTGGTNALTVTNGAGMTLVQLVGTGAATTAEDPGDYIDCLITTTATATCVTYAKD